MLRLFITTLLISFREISSQRYGILQLQEAFLSDFLNHKDFKVGNKDRGVNLIKVRLCCKKVHLVVDVLIQWSNWIIWLVNTVDFDQEVQSS